MIAPANNNGSAELLIYREIGPYDGALSAAEFVSQLDALGPVKSLTVRINSPGGSVFDGMAIYARLSQHPADVNVIIDGLAASAASFIAMAGDRISIAESASMMIHSAWGIVAGNAKLMYKTGDIMQRMDDQIAAIYGKRTGKPASHFLGLMDEETWFTAAEAQQSRLVDVITPNKAAPAKFDARALSKFSRKPAEVAAHLNRLSGNPPVKDRKQTAADRQERRMVLRARLAVEMNPVQRRALEVQIGEIT